MSTTTKPMVNQVVWLDSGNIWINGREMTTGAYLKMTQHQRDKLASEYATSLGSGK
jgi:hypothetical protein